jgi:UDP-GlcNAc:undecaprenyl-phosphate GlcNAc-1-phosphate transferase
MDGLATVVAIVASLNFLLFALLFNQVTHAIVLAAFLGSLIGFLYYNKPDAQIYLGDTGSLYIGGFLATVPFLLPWNAFYSWGYIAPAFILAVPLLELFFLVCIRTYKRIPFYNASPDHFAIQLLQAGWSKFAILYFIFVFSCLCSLIAWAVVLSHINIFRLIILILILPISWFFLVGYYSNVTEMQK